VYSDTEFRRDILMYGYIQFLKINGRHTEILFWPTCHRYVIRHEPPKFHLDSLSAWYFFSKWRTPATLNLL